MEEKVSIGGLVFDATLKTDHASKLTATSHPVENGASISDHAFVEPAEVSFEIGVSDAEADRGTFGTGERGVTAFRELLKLQTSRKLIKAVTRLRTYENMLIMSVSAPDDYTTMNAFKAIIMLREIPVVGTKTVAVSARGGGSAQTQKSGSTNSGAVQAAAPKQSMVGVYPAANLLEQFAYMGLGSAVIVGEGDLPAHLNPDDRNLGRAYYLVWGDTVG